MEKPAKVEVGQRWLWKAPGYEEKYTICSQWPATGDWRGRSDDGRFGSFSEEMLIDRATYLGGPETQPTESVMSAKTPPGVPKPAKGQRWKDSGYFMAYNGGKLFTLTEEDETGWYDSVHAGSWPLTAFTNGSLIYVDDGVPGEPKKCGCGVVLPDEMKTCVDCEPCLLAPDGKKWGVDCDHSPHFFKNGMQQPCEHADCAFKAPPKKASSVCKCGSGRCGNSGPHKCGNCGEMCPGKPVPSRVPPELTGDIGATASSTRALPQHDFSDPYAVITANPEDGKVITRCCKVCGDTEDDGHCLGVKDWRAHNEMLDRTLTDSLQEKRASKNREVRPLTPCHMPGSNPPQPIAYRTRTVK